MTDFFSIFFTKVGIKVLILFTSYITGDTMLFMDRNVIRAFL